MLPGQWETNAAVGDSNAEKVAPKLKELGFGEVRLIDADGNPVK